MLNVLDKFSGECLAIRVCRRIFTVQVIDELTDLFISLGTPRVIGCDNGPELVAEAVRRWITPAGPASLSSSRDRPGSTHA